MNKMNQLSIIVLALCLMQVLSFHLSSFNTAVRSPIQRSSRLELDMISHGKRVKRLSRPADQRKALVRGLTTEVIRHGRIRTTVVRAKAIRKYVDKMITLAKKGSLHHRRQALSFLYDKDLVASLFEAAPDRYGDRNGGYCRVIKEELPRRGDAAKMAIIELV